jgi:hypothetical protein
MTAIISADDVFDFMGSPDDVRDNDDTIAFIEDLITQKQSELSTMLGRVIDTATTESDKLFRNGLDCSRYGDKLYFKGIYRDILTITSVKEGSSSALSVCDKTNRQNDYLVDANLGRMIRVNSIWDDSDFILVSGTFGYLNSNGSPKAEIKNILKELVAVASRLWKTYVQNEQVGQIEVIRNDVSKSTRDLITKLTPRAI